VGVQTPTENSPEPSPAPAHLSVLSSSVKSRCEAGLPGRPQARHRYRAAAANAEDGSSVSENRVGSEACLRPGIHPTAWDPPHCPGHWQNIAIKAHRLRGENFNIFVGVTCACFHHGGAFSPLPPFLRSISEPPALNIFPSF